MTMNTYLTSFTKKLTQNGLKTFKKPYTIKLLEENIGKKLHDIGLGNYFLAMTLKAQVIKAKMDKWNYIKLKSLCRENKSTQ